MPGTTGDALLAYLTIYGIDGIYSASDSALRERIQKSWSEFAVCSIPEPIELDLYPCEKNAPGFFSGILPVKKTKTLNVLYVYENSPETSAWIAAHDEGRKKADEYFNGKVSSRFAENVSSERFESVIREETEKVADVVFAASSELLPACLKAAAEYPDVKFLNCSAYSFHPTIRSYSGRMYEVKFLEGLIAGTMTHTHKIGYIADYPIYGEPAAINAFAKGAAMTDPYVEIILRWHSQRDGDPLNEIVSCGADLTASHDGLYTICDGKYERICGSKINWGEFYIRILSEIFDRTWKNSDKENPKAVNYWWGLSAGVFDVDYTSKIPPDTLRLVSILYDDVISGRVAFF
ncbi:MAG: BMP family ABC transporter substrate-binding protein, partial [Clostridiales bacterium]|nr:BMP family ABC transporter substrate-binding protein [Clostridiales bacterium]